jgi:hypothetical protein
MSTMKRCVSFGGLCIVVDLESAAVVARAWFAKEGGCRVSNVAVRKEYLLLAGDCGILT